MRVLRKIKFWELQNFKKLLFSVELKYLKIILNGAFEKHYHEKTFIDYTEKIFYLKKNQQYFNFNID